MSKKLTVAILCGGQSAEHEVSVNSAKNIIGALDTNRYNIKVVFINKEGAWFLFDSTTTFLNAAEPNLLTQTPACEKVTLPLGENKVLLTLSNKPTEHHIDVIFPALHGAHGEDGTMQGLFELANIPYVGPGVLGSSVCMDKEVSKQLLRNANIKTADWLSVTRDELANLNFETVKQKLGLPFFIKPANTGSSVGISKVKTSSDFTTAVELALQYDHKILFEQYIAGREIECSVLGNEHPECSLPGEIIPHHEFYTYEAKYLDPNGAELVIPAKLSDAVIKKVQETAKKAFKALCCEGMARVDFFVTADDEVVINEANTIPGFTQISMYPKLWIQSGMSYSTLLDKLIELALARFQRDRVLVNKKLFTKHQAA